MCTLKVPRLRSLLNDCGVFAEGTWFKREDFTIVIFAKNSLMT